MKLRLISQRDLDALVQAELRQHELKLRKDYEHELLEKQMNLDALQGQINPHFLYNALECIRGQAMMENVPEIADITKALSRFFRYSISIKRSIVTLREELDNVRNYMKVQEYRFRNRFTLLVENDPNGDEALNAMIPKMVLQPIVENAVLHGFENASTGAVIAIRIERTKRHINIKVSDNGCGMDSGTLVRVMDKLRNGEEQSMGERSSGIALGNVDKRIKLYFGEEYGLVINSAQNVGTDVEIHIPFQTE